MKLATALIFGILSHVIATCFDTLEFLTLINFLRMGSFLLPICFCNKFTKVSLHIVAIILYVPVCVCVCVYVCVCVCVCVRACV